MLVLGLVGCGAVEDESIASTAPSVSASIVLVGDVLWVASPDDDAIVAVDSASLAEISRIAVGGAPSSVALAPDGGLVVATGLDSSVVVVDPGTGSVRPVTVPCGGLRGVVAYEHDGRSWALATCPHDGRVVYVDLEGAQLAATVALGGRPSALAFDGQAVHVTDSAGGRVWRLSPGAPDVQSPWDAVVTASAASAIAVPGDRTPSQLDAIALIDGAPVWAFQSVDNDGNRERAPELGGYGNVIDGDPRIEPMLGGACAGRYARFDGRERVFSGPSAIAATDELVWVVNAYTSNVAVLRCEPRDGLLDLRASFRVGDGARGIVLSADGQTAWVDNGFDHSVARLELPQRDGAYVADAPTLRRDAAMLRLSPAAEAGRRLFADALDVQLTPSGIVTCATCHPNGGQDGLLWFLHTETVPRKLRRTPPAWQVDAVQVPLHWDGEFGDGAELVRGTIEGLMGGLALGVDADSMVAYMRELPAPPPRPIGPTEQQAASLGATLFASAEVGCTECHSGERGSDGLMHEVLEPSVDPDAALVLARTPVLTAVRTRAPFLHDGRSATLRDLLTTDNTDDRHGRTRSLDPQALDALLLYLETR